MRARSIECSIECHSSVLVFAGRAINKSLSALGNVVEKLATKSTGHIPYRDSKLTYLLSNALQVSIASAYHPGGPTLLIFVGWRKLESASCGHHQPVHLAHDRELVHSQVRRPVLPGGIGKIIQEISSQHSRRCGCGKLPAHSSIKASQELQLKY
jgi:hypothetical protein